MSEFTMGKDALIAELQLQLAARERAADPEAVGECWLVWALTMKGNVVLLAVDMAQSVADRHRRFALAPPNDYVRVYVEHVKTNHLYGETIFNERNPSRAGFAPRSGE